MENKILPFSTDPTEYDTECLGEPFQYRVRPTYHFKGPPFILHERSENGQSKACKTAPKISMEQKTVGSVESYLGIEEGGSGAGTPVGLQHIYTCGNESS